MRKPDLCFFRHVLDEINLHPGQVVMVDDKAENICAARSVGIHGVLANGAPTGVGQTLRNLFLDPISRAETYLRNNAGSLDSVAEGRDIVIKDNFCQLMIWELTGNADIIYLRWPSGKVHGAQTLAGDNDDEYGHMMASVRGNVENGLWNYFYGAPVLTTQQFPPDADTTSTAYLSVPESYPSEMADVKLVLDIMANNTSPDGIMQTYFCDDRPRTSPEVCCNILRAFYRFGRQRNAHSKSHSPPDPRIRRTEEWVVRCLENRAYLYGSRVYSVPEAFLYFAARLYAELKSSHSHDHDPYPLEAELEPIKEALLERINAEANPLALALRISACQLVGLDRSRYRQDLDALKALQEADGGWPAGHFCCTGRTGDRIGNRGLATALAAKIIRHEEELLLGSE